MDDNKENLSKDKEIKVVLPFNCDKITDKEGMIIVAIWLIPTCLCLMQGKYDAAGPTLLDIFPCLIPWWTLWTFFGWAFPALYFKWKHRNEKVSKAVDESEQKR